jgi:hypothetical protein
LHIWLFLKQWSIFQSTVKTYGKLIGWGEESSTPNPQFPRPYYYAQVAFETPDRSRHQVSSAVGSRPKPKTPMGHPMPVRYDPENPDDARLDTFFDFWDHPPSSCLPVPYLLDVHSCMVDIDY